MRVLLAAAEASIGRLTPHNISSSVWALSKLAGEGSGLAPAQGLGFTSRTAPGAGGDTGGAATTGSFPEAGSAAADTASDTDTSASGDEGLGSGESSGDDVLRPVAPVNAARQSTAAGIAQLLQGLAGATAQRAAEFKPAHIGDAFWGFGSLGMHPGNAALGGLLDAAAAAGAPGFKGFNAGCALIGLGRLVAAHPHALHAQHVMQPCPEPGIESTAAGGAAAETGGDAAAAAAAVPVPVLREMREHPGLTLLARVVGASAPSLTPARLAEARPRSNSNPRVVIGHELGLLGHALAVTANLGSV